ncbi:hypothetical protein NMY22_g6052 [Coprinellus aureogranulatus]|nr:hypothetical protein NMY22_g6052 [Coprinellus aureogranulatus]
MSKVLKEYTVEEISKHNKEGDLWVVIDAKVYDLTRFADLHPGGASVLFADAIAGKDATQAFFGLHKHEVLLRPQYKRLQIGTVVGQKEKIKAPVPGALSKVPYAEPTWLTKGYYSPYYTGKHHEFQTAVREFFETVVAPEAAKCEDSGKKISQEVVDKMAEANIIAMRLGPGKHLQGRTLMGGLVKPEEFDYFYEGIVHQELARVSSRAVVDGLLAGLVIGLPPILNFGSKELYDRVVPETLAGKKYVALAITEAFAGSDVSGLQTTAVREGDEWVITGTKKWITNGTFADYFTTGCRTENGFTVILIPRGPGVSTKQIKTAYSSVAGTAYVTFDKVRVPVGNTLGQVGKGMQVILSNFNHERWMVCCTSVSTQRLVIEECLKWATQRIVFGKPLTNLAVIRSKLAMMIARVETSQNWLESVTYQMCNMNYAQQSDKLAGPIGLLKTHISRSGRENAEEAVQIFGGRALTVTGMGKFIENFHRTSGFDAILAGAEDVLSDLGVRQALKKMPAEAKLATHQLAGPRASVGVRSNNSKPSGSILPLIQESDPLFDREVESQIGAAVRTGEDCLDVDGFSKVVPLYWARILPKGVSRLCRDLTEYIPKRGTPQCMNIPLFSATGIIQCCGLLNSEGTRLTRNASSPVELSVLDSPSPLPNLRLRCFEHRAIRSIVVPKDPAPQPIAH